MSNNIHVSGEDYLGAVLILKKKGYVCSIDIVWHMAFSKPNICHAVSVLKSDESFGKLKKTFG